VRIVSPVSRLWATCHFSPSKMSFNFSVAQPKLTPPSIRSDVLCMRTRRICLRAMMSTQGSSLVYGSRNSCAVSSSLRRHGYSNQPWFLYRQNAHAIIGMRQAPLVSFASFAFSSIWQVFLRFLSPASNVLASTGRWASVGYKHQPCHEGAAAEMVNNISF
jgi:hypothetical protein